MLRERPNDFDLVLSDVYMPDMDGFKLLETVGLELDLPVIMMSSNGETSTVLRGVTHGAVDFLIKPVRIEELRNVWQHVVRRRRELVRAPHPPPRRKRRALLGASRARATRRSTQCRRAAAWQCGARAMGLQQVVSVGRRGSELSGRA